MRTGPGLHSRIVAVLKVGLPLVAFGLILSIFITRPETQDGAEIVFSEGSLNEIGDGFQIENPTFSGTTANGDTFQFSAAKVEPDAVPPTQAAIDGLDGEIRFPDGAVLEIASSAGALDISDRILDLAGDVRIVSSTGYRLTSEELAVDLRESSVAGRGRIFGTGPLGSISSETMQITRDPVDGSNRLFSFGNGVRVLYDPAPDTTNTTRDIE